MDYHYYLLYSVPITLVCLLATIFLSIRAKRFILKYLPSIFVLLACIVFCIVFTVINYNSYIGILYIVAFLIILPSILLSLIVSISFDILRIYKRKRNAEKQ
jgi:hypothetical protein